MFCFSAHEYCATASMLSICHCLWFYRGLTFATFFIFSQEKRTFAFFEFARYFKSTRHQCVFIFAVYALNSVILLLDCQLINPYILSLKIKVKLECVMFYHYSSVLASFALILHFGLFVLCDQTNVLILYRGILSLV